MKFSQLKNVNNLVKVGITAGLYIVLTVGLSPIGYGAIQFRLSELLNILAFINPVYGFGVVLGCLISNLFSPFGIFDIIFGTASTYLAVYFISKTKNLFIATLILTVFSSIVAGVISYYTNTPFWINAITVMTGEFIVCTIIGYPIFKYIFANEKLNEFLKSF